MPARLPWHRFPVALLSIASSPAVAAESTPEPAPAPDLEPRASGLWSRDLGGARLRLIDLAAITQVSVGGSGGSAEELEWSQSGAHDPRRDGFDFQQLELSISGAVDPYFHAEAHCLLTEDEGLELEEAFAITTDLPYGLEVEAGLMLTEFGRYNPRHSHEYAHIDQPLVIGTMFGAEGTRDLGLRAAWLLPSDWFSELHLTVQNGDNETAVSFLGEGHQHGEEEEEHGSRNIDAIDELMWSARWVNGWAIDDDLEVQLGISAAYGPNLRDDHTILYGADLVVKWFDPVAIGGAGTLAWTTEFIARQTGAAEAGEAADDWGLVSTIVYDFTPRWQAGLRLDYVDLEEHHDDEAEEEHVPARRLRLSPLLGWRPSEFTRFRLQYNWSDPDEGNAVHSVWLGLEVLIGTHPAHTF